MADHIIRALCTSGGIRILACSAGQLAAEVCSLQGTSLTASIALARGLAGGALMGALLKDNQRIALKFEGSGPLRKMIVEADADGAVRGTVAVPSAEVEPQGNRWNVPALIGRAGFLTVSKDLGVGGEPYLGLVQLQTSEIGDDLAYYLTDSEQIPSAVGLGAALDTNGLPALCGGFLIQALPGTDDRELDAIMHNITTLPPLTGLLESGGPAAILQALFGDIPYTLLETHDIFFRCGCSREKVEKAVMTLGAGEIRDMLDKDGFATVSCEFCRKSYRLENEQLEALIGQLSDGKS